MQRHHPFDLRDAASSEIGCFRDAHAGLPKPDNPSMMSKVGLPPGVAPCPLGDLYPFTLAFASGFVIVARSLQRDAEQHVLDRFKHNA